MLPNSATQATAPKSMPTITGTNASSTLQRRKASNSNNRIPSVAPPPTQVISRLACFCPSAA
ncbi:UDP-4-amino-4-deoxy-L-arabinose--oxoglutarate aminotransferase [Pseudomonas syringae pv. coryli]|uniref:UDP-4-amino-4-deoxy-L-arabinose--oxoglutarate aminotransferase n=1 Tax=Pseudomonas syringae pv. coryli TaxID=317659 RepID=A0A0N8R697_9PSED|nr:UDP-4-amino-4-deoxy-L-arabinose--oxoglutarate aminotransferase [Pseudomonas syringae pv. coryli]